MNYITCQACEHQNKIISERTIFCKKCKKKLDNNFIDWKKSKSENTFDDYLKASAVFSVNDKECLKTKYNKEEKTPSYDFSVLKNKQNLALLSFIIISWFVVFDILKNSLGYFNSNNDKNLSEITWKKHILASDISVDFPISLKKQETRLGCYLADIIGNVKSSHGETSSKSFSVTIEEIEIQNTYMLGYTPLINVYDEFMSSSNGEFYLHTDLTTSKIKNYISYVDRGSYLLEGDEYNYENYTLYKQNKAIKIIVSYLENDKDANFYSERIAKSLFLNNTKNV